MSKRARLTSNELTTLLQAEIACRVGIGNSMAGGKAEKILEKYNELISQGKSKARRISKSSIEHKLADLRHDGKIPPAAANLPTEERPLDSETSWSLDEPWSVGCLAKYDIPSEALPSVMSAYKKRLAENDVLTIREALWIGRLYGVIDPKDLVYDWAFLYALEEQISEILGKPFDSRNLDSEMMYDPYYARETQREIAIWEIGEKYGADPVKLKDLNLSIEQTEEIAKSGKYKKEAQHERTHNQAVQKQLHSCP